MYSAKFFHFYMFGSINIPQNSPNFLHPSLCYSVCVRRVVLSESEICFDPVSFMMYKSRWVQQEKNVNVWKTAICFIFSSKQYDVRNCTIDQLCNRKMKKIDQSQQTKWQSKLTPYLKPRGSIKIEKSKGLRTDPWGTPRFTPEERAICFKSLLIDFLTILREM